MSIIEGIQTYLQAYLRKDLITIRELFSEDIQLSDWKISVTGRDAAIAETAKNFSAARTIEIETYGMYTNGDTVAAELRIVVDGEVELRVVDVVSFDAAGRIKQVRAYLGSE